MWGLGGLAPGLFGASRPQQREFFGQVARRMSRKGEFRDSGRVQKMGKLAIATMPMTSKPKSHNPYLPKLKNYLTRVLYPEDFENGPRCKQCGKLETDGFALQVCHLNNDGAQDRRGGTGNHYYMRLYNRAIEEVRAGRPPSVQLLCTGCHGNPKRTDKRGVS